MTVNHTISVVAKNAVRKFFTLGFLAIIFTFFTQFSAQSITLTWNQSPDPAIVGYRVYYGGASGVYTNKIYIGNLTSVTLPGLVNGADYYFAVTAYDSSGVESPYSNEVYYFNSTNAVLSLKMVNGNGASSVWIQAKGVIPASWALESSTDLKTWTRITYGTSPAVNLLLAIDPSVPRQFYRLASN